MRKVGGQSGAVVRSSCMSDSGCCGNPCSSDMILYSIYSTEDCRFVLDDRDIFPLLLKDYCFPFSILHSFFLDRG